MKGGGGGGVGNLRLARCQEPCLTSRTQTKQFHFYTSLLLLSLYSDYCNTCQNF